MMMLLRIILLYCFVSCVVSAFTTPTINKQQQHYQTFFDKNVLAVTTTIATMSHKSEQQLRIQPFRTPTTTPTTTRGTTTKCFYSSSKDVMIRHIQNNNNIILFSSSDNEENYSDNDSNGDTTEISQDNNDGTGFDGKGFANYLAPYALALLLSIAVTGAAFKFIFLQDY